MATNKTALRREVLERRNRLSDLEQKRASALICERILGHQWFYRSDYILLFVSYGSEIDTYPLMEETLRLKKHLFLPRIIGDQMEFFEVTDLNVLETGYKGIKEPPAVNPFQYEEAIAEKTLMLMPGVVFDPFRNRIGYGKGFYDRFLQDKPGLMIRTIAIGHKCQVVAQIESEEHDIKPYQVICV